MEDNQKDLKFKLYMKIYFGIFKALLYSVIIFYFIIPLWKCSNAIS